MITRPVNRLPSGRAFTLIEVMLAVAITGLVAFGIFAFVKANLDAVAYSKELSLKDLTMRAMMKIIQDQLNNLPNEQQGALTGEAHKFNNLPCDEMTWLCGAGLGLFTIHALVDYNVTLALKPGKDPNVSVLGVRRIEADGKNKDENWLPLMKDVKAMEIRYFDLKGINAWVENWTDQSRRPSLVRVRIWRTGDSEPYEAIFNLPLITPPNT